MSDKADSIPPPIKHIVQEELKRPAFVVTLHTSHFVTFAISSVFGAGVALLTYLALSASSIGTIDCKSSQITIIRYRYGEVEKVCVPARLASKVKTTLTPPSKQKRK